MADQSAEERVPHCPRCGGDLAAEDTCGLLRPLGVLLLAAAALTLPVWPFSGESQVAYVAAAVAAVAGLILLAGRPRWRCVSCNATFRRRRPPRQAAASDEDYDSSSFDSSDSAGADDD